MIVLHIAARDLGERKLVWAVGAFSGLVGAAMPWLKGLTGFDPHEAAAVVAVSLVFGSAVALAAVLGATLIPADLAGRRMSFYLVRPVSVAKLLCGRFLGAWLLTAGCAALAGLIQVPFHPRETGAMALAAGIAALFAVPVLLLFHCLGLAWRARTPWLLLDLASMSGFVWVQGWLFQRLLQAGAWDALPWLLGATAAALPLVLAAAVYLQLERGRTNLGNGHRVMSLTLASGLAALTLAGMAFAGWAGSHGSAKAAACGKLAAER